MKIIDKATFDSMLSTILKMEFERLSEPFNTIQYAKVVHSGLAICNIFLPFDYVFDLCSQEVAEYYYYKKLEEEFEKEKIEKAK
jgi:hypothetical protein